MFVFILLLLVLNEWRVLWVASEYALPAQEFLAVALGEQPGRSLVVLVGVKLG
jgi:hypothetical protein